MSSVIATNIYSLNAQKNLAKNSLGLATALERLSSGLRVNSAKDDAAGLAIGMTMDNYARSISASIRAESDTISKAQIADGALQTVGDIALRMSELVSQYNNYAGDTTSQGYISTELSSLSSAAGTVQTNATFNGATTFASISVTSANVATAIGSIASLRATQGATINTSEFKIQSHRTNFENQMAAKSRIMDADYAQETSSLARYQILQQAGTAMVAQANGVPQNVLSLLR